MVTNFEEITEELTPEELRVVPYMISAFEKHKKENPIKAPEIVNSMNAFLKKYEFSVKMTGARLRKFCNHIRTNGLLPLIATKKGYYVSYDKTEIEKQVRSLCERAASIRQSADGMAKFIV